VLFRYVIDDDINTATAAELKIVLFGLFGKGEAGTTRRLIAGRKLQISTSQNLKCSNLQFTTCNKSSCGFLTFSVDIGVIPGGRPILVGYHPVRCNR
jgi:hypothetical protein